MTRPPVATADPFTPIFQCPGFPLPSSPPPENFSLWHSAEQTRVSIERAGNRAAEGQLFQFARVHYAPGGGLYFLARFENENSRALFEAALSLLGDSGIGADRSSGHGLFEWQAGAVPDLRGAPAVALSLLLPAAEDYRDAAWLEGAAYDLTRRGGWISGGAQRKAALRLFTEGSCFQRAPRGCTAHVGEFNGHPVYRDGRGFFAGE